MSKPPKKPSKKEPKKKAGAGVPASAYVPTNAECDVLSELIDRFDQARPQVAAKVEVDGTVTRLSWDHPSQPVACALWASALGTTDFVFAGTLFEQIAQVARTGSTLTKTDFNGTLALVRGLAPTDPTEAMLAAQMAAVHNASMVAARRLAHAEELAQQDSASSMLNKLMRTFALQVEAMKKYRLKGEQTIKVQHVTVNDGGQAIVGNVEQSRGGSLNSRRQTHELTAPDALGPALLGHFQTNAQPMPGPGREGESRVPVPRRPSRSAKRPSQRRLPARQPHQ